MRKSQKATQARRLLDRKFLEAKLDPIRFAPHSGWIRSIRSALGMSQIVLADRLHISKAAVAKLERAESSGGITINKMSEIARALDCNFVYTLVPNITLEKTVQEQARFLAKKRLGYIATTMALEDQATSIASQSDHLETYVHEMIDKNDVWTKG